MPRAEHQRLGLAIKRLLVQGHGVTIRAESATSGGAEFVIELPLASVDV